MRAGAYWIASAARVYNAPMGTEAVPKLSYQQFRELPGDGKRYELIKGYVHFLPTPSTRHQTVLGNLSRGLGSYLRGNRSGEVFFAPLDVVFSEDTALQPDLIFISNVRAGIIQENFIAGAPELVVEVLSPSTAAHDRATKLPIYADAGVPEVWLIDSQAKTVEVLKLQGRKYLVEATLASDHTLTSALFPGWQLPLTDLFDFRGRF